MVGGRENGWRERERLAGENGWRESLREWLAGETMVGGRDNGLEASPSPQATSPPPSPAALSESQSQPALKPPSGAAEAESWQWLALRTRARAASHPNGAGRVSRGRDPVRAPFPAAASPAAGSRRAPPGLWAVAWRHGAARARRSAGVTAVYPSRPTESVWTRPSESAIRVGCPGGSCSRE